MSPASAETDEVNVPLAERAATSARQLATWRKRSASTASADEALPVELPMSGWRQWSLAQPANCAIEGCRHANAPDRGGCSASRATKISATPVAFGKQYA